MAGSMTVAQARKKLPTFAKQLAPWAYTAGAVRDAVMQELETYEAGKNPLSQKHVAALRKFLEETKA